MMTKVTRIRKEFGPSCMGQHHTDGGYLESGDAKESEGQHEGHPYT